MADFRAEIAQRVRNTVSLWRIENRARLVASREDLEIIVEDTADGVVVRLGVKRPEQTPPPVQDPVEADDDLERLTVAALREMAEYEDVDITGLQLKAEIVEAIREARG